MRLAIITIFEILFSLPCIPTILTLLRKTILKSSLINEVIKNARVVDKKVMHLAYSFIKH